MAAVVGVDLGTNGLRGIIVDADGNLLGRAGSHYETRAPRAGWAEQDPEDWWDAFQEVCRELQAQSGSAWGGIAAIGFTGQSPGIVLVDDEGEALGPAIIWKDRRAVVEAQALEQAGSPEQWKSWTGFENGFHPGMRPAKIRWVVTHEPDRLGAARWILQPKDFLIYRLTGRAIIDRTAMNGSSLSHEPGGLLGLLGVDHRLFPEPVASDQVVAMADHGVEGLAGTPVVPGTFDGRCGVLGSGIRGAGEAANVAGTSQIAGLAVGLSQEVVGVTCAGLADGIWFLGGPTETGGGTTEAAMRVFGFRDWKELEYLASRSRSGAGGLLFLPYLDGERTPLWDSRLRGALVGLSSSHEREDVARALIEGHGLVVADIVDRVEKASGQTARVLRCTGGMARSAVARQARAAALGIPVVQPKTLDGSALGACLFAAVALGWHPDPVSAGSVMVAEGEVVEPPAGWSGREQLERFRGVVGSALP